MRPSRSYPTILRLTLLCCCLGWGGCAPKPPPAPVAPSQVQDGRLYVSGQSEFDGMFRELHDLQQLLREAPEQERMIRKTLAAALAIDDGATRQILTDRLTTKASELSARKVRVKLDVEGLDADDEADTMAQAKVVGTLDEEARKLVEATTTAARQALRFAARLRHVRKRLEHLAHHASALDPWVDSTFGRQGTAKASEVHRNLDDARRQMPLLSVRASELADEARRTVQKLAQTITTDPTLGSGKEPPLIAPVEPPTKPKPRPALAPSTRKPPTAPSGAAKPMESGSADFEP